MLTFRTLKTNPATAEFESVDEVDGKDVDKRTPETKRSKRHLVLRSSNVTALQGLRGGRRLLGLRDAEGFLFCTH